MHRLKVVDVKAPQEGRHPRTELCNLYAKLEPVLKHLKPSLVEVLEYHQRKFHPRHLITVLHDVKHPILQLAYPRMFSASPIRVEHRPVHHRPLRIVSEELIIPTIGIGGGAHADGQVLVTHDMVGITKDFHPRFLRRYLELFDVMKQATEQYIRDVKSGDFPNENEQY